MTRRDVLLRMTMTAALACAGMNSELRAQTATKSPPSSTRPVLVLETAKGTAEIELYPDHAPKTVAHVLNLVKKYFYNGQRIHRLEPGSLIQFGDKRSRDMTQRAYWGQGGLGGSGTTIGVAEFSKTLRHTRGVVGMAHAGDPKLADSQIFVNLRPHAEFNGKYVAFGKVVSGLDVLAKLQETDRIVKITVKG